MGQMFVVTLLWSSSFPIHKALMGGGMPPLSLAAYRYFSASLILVLVLGLREGERIGNRALAGVRLFNRHSGGSGALVGGRSAGGHSSQWLPAQWLMLLGIGFFMYTAQGIHLTALSLIAASDSGLVSMSCMPVAVAILAPLMEKTPPTWVQTAGLGIILAGLYVYFPHNLGGARLAGVLLNVLSASMWAVAVVLTHIAVNRMRITSLKLTTISMFAGSFLLLIVAFIHDRVYVPSAGQLLWLAYLAVVNTSFAFALYNHTMKSLGAFEIAAFQDSMVIQIGVLSAIFLGESISLVMALGMLLVVVGVGVVQYFAPARRSGTEIRYAQN